MNHPYEQLADLVDGTLDENALAGVRAHLDVCASCREDVANATDGRDAARSIPQAPAPTDLHQRVVAAAGGGRGHRAPGWYRWAGVAAAAAVVVAIAIILPNVGTGDSDGVGGTSQQEEDAAREAAALGGDVPVEVHGENYDAEDLEDLARASDSATTAGGEAAPQLDGGADARAAVRCVTRAFDDQPVGRLARLIQARFEGRAAFIAVYLEGPGADEPPDTAAVWVAARDGCTILSFASARI